MNHTVVAMVGEQIVRVECNTCHSVHNHHPVKIAKEPKTASATVKKVAAPRQPKLTQADAEAAEWLALQPTMDPDRAIPYDMNAKYRTNALILHPIFGLGIVQIVQPNKVDVLFQEGKKRLRCG